MFKRTAFLLVFCIHSCSVYAQMRISEQDDDILRMQMSTGFLSVVRQARINLDSNLVIVSQRDNLSRIPIITEGIDDIGPLENYQWMDNNNTAVVERKSSSLKGKEHTKMLLLLGAYYTFKPAVDNRYTAKAKTYLEEAKQECAAQHLSKWEAHCNILLGKCYIKEGDLEKAKAHFKTVTDDTTHLNDKALQVKALNYEALYCPFSPATVLFRIACLQRSLPLSKALGDHVNQVNAMTDIAYLSFAAGKLKDSKAAAEQSLALQRAIGFPYTHYTTDLLALLARIDGDFSLQLKIALSSIETAERKKDSLGLGYFYIRVADAYVQNDNHLEESNFWNKKALDEFIKQGGDPALYVIFTGDAFLDSGLGGSKDAVATIKKLLKDYPPNNTIDEQVAYIAIAVCYENEKDYVNAEKYFIMAEKLEKPNSLIRGNIGNGYIYHRMGFFYLHAGNYKKSKEYSLKFVAGDSKLFTDSLQLSATYLALFKADSALGDFPKMQYLYKHMTMNDRLYTEKKNKQLDELTIRYQTVQKEKDLEKYKAQSLLQAQEAANTKRSIIVGALIMLLITGIILVAYVGKQKSNRKLQAQKDEIDHKNRLLQAVINEKDELLVSKEWLLKEVHHRVKNNLQLVMSLLNSQSTHLKDETALNAVLESRHRVQAMSLIHQKLYQEDNASSIAMRDYINNLIEYLKDSFKTKLSVYFELTLDPISLDVSQAIPVGLILNEIITNALKYAFPNTDDDRISISLRKTSGNNITLIVTDNGKGLRADFDIAKSKSFGMVLIHGLTEDLDGTFIIESRNGTMIKIVFPMNEFSQKESAAGVTSHR